jgi:4-hydroxybenzoate polyprenyltransferase
MGFTGLLRLVRWPGALTAASNAATAFLVVRTLLHTGELRAVAGAAVGGALVYTGGVALNDAEDAERDATLHPTRPVPSGEVSASAARTLGLVLFVIGSAASMALAGAWAGAATAAAALFAYVYDTAAKRARLPGAVALGLARAANVLAGALAAAGSAAALEAAPSALPLLMAVAVFTYAAILTWASTHEGASPSLALSAFFAIALAVVAALPWPWFTAQWRAAPALALLPLAATLVAAARRAGDADGLGSGIDEVVRAGVFGFLLADAAWLFGVGRYDTGFALLVVYVAVRLVLARARS